VEGPLLGSEINLAGNIHLQEFFPAGVAEHGDQSIIHFHEAAFGGAEKEPFLNVVEQFAVTALGLAAVRDVF
jgi:hypothetical protein